MSTSSEFETKQKTTEQAEKHAKDPLHGITLKEIVTLLEKNIGWEALAIRIPIRCFQHDPSVQSTLKFLRKTPWARAKVEALYVQSSRNWGKYKPKADAAATPKNT